MKFDFDKHVPKEEQETNNETQEHVIEELSQEEQQEKFEQECIAEAEKLDLKLGELQKEIDSLGGPEEFAKRAAREQGPDTQYNDANLEYQKNEASKEARNRMIGAAGMLAAGIASIAVVFESQGVRIDPTILDQLQWVVQNKTQAFAEGQNLAATGLSAVFSSTSALFAGSSISRFFKKRKIERQQKKASLMRKMSGSS